MATFVVALVAVLGLGGPSTATTIVTTNSVDLSAHVSATSIALGAATNVAGTVKPRGATPRVVVQRRIDGRWYDRNSGPVGPDGTFKISIRPVQPGIYALRVRSNGGSIATPAFYLRVRP